MPVRTAVRSWRSTSAPSRAARFLTKRAKHGRGTRELIVEDRSSDVEQITDERVANLVLDRRPLLAGGHDVLGTQDRELLRDGRLIEPQARLKLLDAPLASAQDLEDPDSDRVGQRLEELGFEGLEAGRRHRINISEYLYISVSPERRLGYEIAGTRTRDLTCCSDERVDEGQLAFAVPCDDGLHRGAGWIQPPICDAGALEHLQ